MFLGSRSTVTICLIKLLHESSIGDVRLPNVHHALEGNVSVLEGTEEVAVLLRGLVTWGVPSLDFNHNGPVENAERLALGNRLNIYESQLLHKFNSKLDLN